MSQCSGGPAEVAAPAHKASVITLLIAQAQSLQGCSVYEAQGCCVACVHLRESSVRFPSIDSYEPAVLEYLLTAHPLFVTQWNAKLGTHPSACPSVGQGTGTSKCTEARPALVENAQLPKGRHSSHPKVDAESDCLGREGAWTKAAWDEWADLPFPVVGKWRGAGLCGYSRVSHQTLF